MMSSLTAVKFMHIRISQARAKCKEYEVLETHSVSYRECLEQGERSYLTYIGLYVIPNR
jgi:hypothetical protein